jgi:O-antigen/teichoic acid export membrane protein
MAFFQAKLVKDAAPGFLQTVVNQLCGLAIFFILSVELDKIVFGEINWTLAVWLSAFALLSFGMDQLVVKKIAAGEDLITVTSLYLLHTLLAGGIFYVLVLGSSVLFHGFFAVHYLLLWIGIGKLAIFIASVFRQVANGREQFRLLAIMMLVSNVLRALALLILWLLHQVNTVSVICVFVAGDIVELVVCWLLAKQKFRITLSLAKRWPQYRLLLKEALPQLGTTILGAITARMDWVLMGLMGLNIQLADYSFAYKIYETALLPLMVIAALLLPRFARMFGSGSIHKNKLFTLLRVEMVFAAATALALYVAWVPVVDTLTAGRYGAVNSCTILLLGATIPVMYLNNLLWTILFSRAQLRLIFYSMLVSFACNLAGNLLLIPLYAGDGAAMAWLCGAVVQCVIMLCAVKMKDLSLQAAWLPVCVLFAASAGYTALYFFNNPLVVFMVAGLLYLLLVVVTGALRKADLSAIR